MRLYYICVIFEFRDSLTVVHSLVDFIDSIIHRRYSMTFIVNNINLVFNEGFIQTKKKKKTT